MGATILGAATFTECGWKAAGNLLIPMGPLGFPKALPLPGNGPFIAPGGVGWGKQPRHGFILAGIGTTFGLITCGPKSSKCRPFLSVVHAWPSS